ncbi:exported hypothetical protein [Sphingobacterium sp. PM2-P1-29]|nr:exported hypothetical protein [Sphingobacterium sp. PM2-P1-29]
MKWILVVFFVSSVYTDAKPTVPVKHPKAIAKPLEDLVPMLEEVTNKLTDLSTQIEKL